MRDTSRTYEFRCPVHGFIELSDWEREIISHSEFQRLRRIRQLAWTEYVYPGATHTRFEHSLGVMHVATRVYESVVNRRRQVFLTELGFNASKEKMTQDFAQRIAVIVALVHRVSGRRLGRTAIMKLMYFLSVLRGVPLGYRFTLYSYGPFDSTVLDDLNSGQQLGILKMRIVGYPSGYGYEIEAGPNVTAPLEFASRFVKKHKEDIDWVVAKFGRSPAAELELAGTIVYVDRESPACSQSVQKLAQLVGDVKPHFSLADIQEKTNALKDEGLLRSIR